LLLLFFLSKLRFQEKITNLNNNRGVMRNEKRERKKMNVQRGDLFHRYAQKAEIF